MMLYILDMLASDDFLYIHKYITFWVTVAFLLYLVIPFPLSFWLSLFKNTGVIVYQSLYLYSIICKYDDVFNFNFRYYMEQKEIQVIFLTSFFIYNNNSDDFVAFCMYFKKRKPNI